MNANVLAGPVFAAPFGRLWPAQNTMLGCRIIDSLLVRIYIGDSKDKFS